MTLVVHSQSDVTLMTEQKTEWQKEALAVSVALIGLFFRSVSSAGGGYSPRVVSFQGFIPAWANLQQRNFSVRLTNGR